MGQTSPRLRSLNDHPLRPSGAYVLYWMTGSRRLHSNFALQHAHSLATELGCPLLIFEPISISFPWASTRFLRFVVEGMQEKRALAAELGVTYLPWVETTRGQASGILEVLAEPSAAVVGDDSCVFFLQRLIGRAGQLLKRRLEVVESDTITPTRSLARVFTTAASYRRAVHKRGVSALLDGPSEDPLAGYCLGAADVPWEQLAPWTFERSEAILADVNRLADLEVDSWVGPSAFSGGEEPARALLARFLARGVKRYADERSQPDAEVESTLSPYLHWGFLSPHEILRAVLAASSWTADRVDPSRVGSRSGWWGLPEGAESFLDQLVVWRELGWNAARHDETFGTWMGIPAWARTTLGDHQGDPRGHEYSMADLEAARTDDPIWNAAQRELVRTGRIQNYLRMVWGKRMLEWRQDPSEAFHTLLHLNNKYALDGRDPNSLSAISWIFGRYDRAWGERPIYGKVRYMSSEATRKKLRLGSYLQRYSAQSDHPQLF